MRYNYRINLENGKFEYDDDKSSLAKSIRYNHNQNVFWGNTINDLIQRVPEYNAAVRAVKNNNDAAVEMIKQFTLKYIGKEGFEVWAEGVRSGVVEEINSNTIRERR